MKDSETPHIFNTFLLWSIHYCPIYPGTGTRHPMTIGDLLSKYGNKVKVVTGFPNSPQGKRPKEYKYRLFKREKLGDIDLLRVYIPPVPHKGIINRLILYLFFLLFSVKGFIIYSSADIIFALGPVPQFFLALPGFFFSKIIRKRLVILVTDLWPDVLIETGVIKSGIFSKFLEAFIRLSLNLADKITVITPTLKKELIRKGIEENKIFITELPIDTTLFQPRVKKIIDERLKEKFVIMYSGIFGPAYDFDTLLQAANILENYSDILFVIRGDGEIKEEIIEKIQTLELDNVVILGIVETIDEVIDYLNMADIFVVPMTKGDKISGSTHPSKVLEFMALEKPLVCAATSELARLIKMSGSGIVVPPGDSVKLASAILTLHNNPIRRDIMGNMGRKYVQDHFSYNSVYHKIISAINY